MNLKVRLRGIIIWRHNDQVGTPVYLPKGGYFNFNSTNTTDSFKSTCNTRETVCWKAAGRKSIDRWGRQLEERRRKYERLNAESERGIAMIGRSKETMN